MFFIADFALRWLHW